MITTQAQVEEDVLSCTSWTFQEEEDEDDVTYVGEPTHFFYSPDSADYNFQIPMEGIVFEEDGLEAARERQRLRPATTETTDMGYDIDRFFEGDCERFLEVSEDGDLDEMREIVQRYASHPAYKLRLVNHIHETV
jgi:hypothetical protein